VIEFDHLSIEFTVDDRQFRALRDCSFTVNPGEAVALVGESGSGKTTAARAALGDIGRTGTIVGGAARLSGQDCFGLSQAGLNAMRRTAVGYVPQNPGAALNPVRRVGKQISEMIPSDGAITVSDLLERVQLSSSLLRRYPHELSGGQQQRVSLAIALASASEALILDEPTTGLDVGVQVEILKLFRSVAEEGLAVLYVTHDLAAASVVADRIVVLYAGEVVETGDLRDVYERPRHPYTEALLAAVPTVSSRVHLNGIPGVMLPGDERDGCCVFHNRCVHGTDVCERERPVIVAEMGRTFRCIRPELVLAGVATAGRAREASSIDPTLADSAAVVSVEDIWVRYQTAGAGGRAAVEAVSLSIGHGETLALVGESGSGKTSLARAITGLVAPARGRVLLDGQQLEPRFRQRSLEELRRIQYVFQNSTLALNPRQEIGAQLQAPLDRFFDLDSAERDARVRELLALVGLPTRLLGLRPRNLSGGEQQRVAIARALAARPDVMICDEIVSALDVSVQASIVGLLGELQAETGVSILFISHDLGVVRSIAHRTAVMYNGSLVELADTEAVFGSPLHSYTEELLASVPDPAAALLLSRSGTLGA
jgi:peptide/nickel transport system ATP-binding protein